jgi:hypothetical protein
MGDMTIDKILLLTIFFIPGFIYLKAYRLFIAETRTDFSKDLYEAIGISLINAIVFAPLLYWVYTNNLIENCAFLYYLMLIFIIIIIPLIEVWIFYKIAKTKWYSKRLLTPNNGAWDDFFSKREPYWVIVTLKSGRKIAGKYAAKSYSSAYPAPKEIYLEEVYELKKDGSFGDIIKQTGGILIVENEISTIEFFN